MKSDVVSIVIPTLNAEKDLKECLRSISKLSYQSKKLEVILVDNGLPPKVIRFITQTYPRTFIIKNSRNESFAKSINQGIKKATGEYIFITNDDVTFDKKSISTLIKHLKTDPKIGIIGGTVFSKTSPPTITSAGHSMNTWTGDLKMQSNPKMACEVDWIQGCAMLVKRTIFSEIGMLDEHFKFYFEDFDLCVRARRAGWKIVYLPTPRFCHGGSVTTNRDMHLKYTYWYQSKILFILKHLPITKVISILLFQTTIVMPYRTLILQDGRLMPFLKGMLWNFYNFSTTQKLRNRNFAYSYKTK